MPYEEEAKQEVYYIPDNYDDAGGVLGGRFKTRNAIETAVICGPILFLETKILHFSWQVNISIGLITILPLLFLCAFGIGGESLSQIFTAYTTFRKKRRTLSYVCFTDLNEDGTASGRILANSRFDQPMPEETETKKTTKKPKEAKKQKKEKQSGTEQKRVRTPQPEPNRKAQPSAQTRRQETPTPAAGAAETAQKGPRPQTPPAGSQSAYAGPQRPWTQQAPYARQQAAGSRQRTSQRPEFASDFAAWEAQMKAAQAKRAKADGANQPPAKKPSSNSNRFLNSAMKEILLRKLELGEDESA